MGKTKRPGRARRIHLTERRIELLPVPARRLVTYDLRVPTLGLRLEPTGAKTFFWWRSVARKPTFKRIGAWPDIKLEAARAKAAEYDVTLATWQKDGCVGPNPFEASPRSSPLTFAELVEDYIQRKTLLTAVNPVKSERGIRWQLDKYLSDWKERRIADVTRQQVFDLHKRLGVKHGKTTANRVVEFICTLYNWATGDAGVWTGVNPAARIARFEENERTRFLDPAELVRFIEALENEPSADFRDYLTLALATGQRKSNILGMPWATVNLEAATWTIPKHKTKNRKPHTCELTDEAMRVLSRRLSEREDDCVWVFPSPAASGHLEDVKKRWKLFLERAALDYPKTSERHLTLHDLRHTNISYQIMAGRSLEQAGAAVGHLSPMSTKRYSHLHQQVQRETVLAGEKKMAAMIAAEKKKQKLLPASK